MSKGAPGIRCSRARGVRSRSPLGLRGRRPMARRAVMRTLAGRSSRPSRPRSSSKERGPSVRVAEGVKWTMAEERRPARPWAYWWWMGSAVNEADLTRELERYARAGMGGVHIIPIYGAKGYEKQYIEYLSPRWMGMMKHSVAEARRLGMDVDMT